MPDALESRCRALVSDLGLAGQDEVLAVRPLVGGVASDIVVVTLAHREICVKFALARLKVAEEWHAPVHRNHAEYAWLSFAGSVEPTSVPRLFGWSAAENGFAMQYITGPDIHLWKTALLKGAPDRGEAGRVGDVLGRIHAASTRPGFERTSFANRDDFRALRLEPYLTFTAARHPSLAPRLIDMADRLYDADVALVHGDVSPKNILFRGTDPVLLDAECATMGDPVFDVSFCLNHLILKAAHLPACRAQRLASVERFWAAYAPHVRWEDPSQMQARATALVPMLMLARVDGKSPVEYLSEADRAKVRALAVSLIERPVATLAELVAELSMKMEQS